ncbi:glycosyltransferase family 4 protein [Rothia nasimurium]|uniref:glycosyltransferase family 4 protein n=1 Tax=Rothia nasimurium TaxID=85336 RepID=UPI001F199F91|nr:glycosyltransferase family 4 protein [Rothia nasimurium]
MDYSVVIISNCVPKTEPTSAGERLIRELYFALKEVGHTPIIFSSRPINKPEEFYDVDYIFLEVNSDSWFQRIRNLYNSWSPNIQLLNAIKNNAEAINILQRARIIDLQWSSNLLLAPWVKKLNPHARVIGTFHDVSKQRFNRRAQSELVPLKSLYWRTLAIAACISENFYSKSLDTLVTLSEKDAKLLAIKPSRRESCQVILPPVYAKGTGAPRQSDGVSILFVGTMYRWENHEAVQWFISEILPGVWEKIPEVRFVVAGESPSSDLVELGADERIEFLGFVDNLDPLYAQAAMVVSPIRLGSGVKFKTLDAILRGVPLVSTSAGIEGIARVEWAAKLANNANTFRQAVLDVLSNSEYYDEKAQKSRQEAEKIYSQETYRNRIAEVYGRKDA